MEDWQQLQNNLQQVQAAPHADYNQAWTAPDTFDAYNQMAGQYLGKIFSADPADLWKNAQVDENGARWLEAGDRITNGAQYALIKDKYQYGVGGEYIPTNIDNLMMAIRGSSPLINNIQGGYMGYAYDAPFASNMLPISNVFGMPDTEMEPYWTNMKKYFNQSPMMQGGVQPYQVQDIPTDRLGEIGSQVWNNRVLGNLSSRQSSFLEDALNESYLIPFIPTMRSFAQGMSNGGWGTMDKVVNSLANIVAPDMHSVGQGIAPYIYNALPSGVQEIGAKLAPIIGALVGGVPGVMGAKLITDMSTGAYNKSPWGTARDAGIQGAAAYLGSELADFAGGLSESDLIDSIRSADAIRNSATEAPTSIGSEAWDAMYGGIEPGTFTGDLQGAYADVASDLATIPAPNTAEMGWITDTARLPGINVLENQPTLTEDQAIANELERDTVLQEMNPIAGTSGGGGSTGDPQLDEELAMDTAEFEQTEHEMEHLEQLEREMNTQRPDTDWDRILKNSSKLLKDLFGGQGEEEEVGGYYMPWGPNRRRMGGGGIGEDSAGGTSRVKKMDKSNYDAALLDDQLLDMIAQIGPDLATYYDWRREA